VLLFLYGTDGFHLVNPKDGKAKAMEYYCSWRLMQGEPGLNVVLCGDRLFQQHVVDSCAKMEKQRLNYLRFNQTVSAADAVLANDEDHAGCRLLNFMHIVCNERN